MGEELVGGRVRVGEWVVIARVSGEREMGESERERESNFCLNLTRRDSRDGIILIKHFQE